MSFATHVFISYAHADNLEVSGPGWVTKFHELLEPYLTSRLKKTNAVIWRDKRLSDNDAFDPVIMKHLPDSAVFVAVLSDNYVESAWCQREARSFCDEAAKGVGLTPGNKQRVFKSCCSSTRCSAGRRRRRPPSACCWRISTLPIWSKGGSPGGERRTFLRAVAVTDHERGIPDATADATATRVARPDQRDDGVARGTRSGRDGDGTDEAGANCL